MVVETPIDEKMMNAFLDGSLTLAQARGFTGMGLTSLKRMVADREVVSKRVRGRRLIGRRSLVERLARGDGES
jgi:hypothetical protein